jgi:hypothetical protein
MQQKTFQHNEVKITASDIPGQTGESVTDVDLTPSPCSTQLTCTGFSDITIQGIGEGSIQIWITTIRVLSLIFALGICVGKTGFLGATFTSFFNTGNAVRGDINIPNIGTGQVTIQPL